MWLTLTPSASSVVTCWWFLSWWVSSSARYTGVYSFHILFLCDQLEEEVKMVQTVGVYSMIFKVPTCREQIGDPLDMHSSNRDILPN